jgi:hypothetical protein
VDNVPDALVVGDGGQRLEQYLVIFAHVIVRTRPADADPIPLQTLASSVGLLTLRTAGAQRSTLKLPSHLIGKI